MKQQILYLDLIRVVACVFVVAIHCNPWLFTIPRGIDMAFAFASMLLIGVAVPLFFMISGALLLPVQMDTVRFYERRIPKIVWPLLIWGILYAWMPYMLSLITPPPPHAEFSDKQLLMDSLKESLLVPVKTPHLGGVLWYLFVLAGLYLLAPFMQGIVSSRRNERIFLLLCFVSTFYILLDQFVPETFGESLASTTTTVTYFSGYIGYFVLGHYMHNYSPVYTKRNMAIAVFLLMAGMILWGAGKYCFGGAYIDSSFSLGPILISVTLFWILKNTPLNEKGRKIVNFIAPLTFGIYLSHLVVITFITGRFYEVSASILVQAGMFVSSFILTVLFVWLLSKFPFSKYIIGI